MSKLLCPSMMCADYGNLRGEVELLEQAGVDIFHVDVMDGQFVPNFAMGFPAIEFLGGITKLPIDAHLMIFNPANYIERLVEAGVSIIYVHPEADPHTPRTLQKIIDAGAKPGICINPGTTAQSIEPLLNLCEYVMVMAVNPGFAGQKFLPFVDEKIFTLVEWKKKYGYRLVADGCCTEERIASLGAKGVDGFVLGNSCLFGKGRPYNEIIASLRK